MHVLVDAHHEQPIRFKQSPHVGKKSHSAEVWKLFSWQFKEWKFDHLLPIACVDKASNTKINTNPTHDAIACWLAGKARRKTQLLISDVHHTNKHARFGCILFFIGGIPFNFLFALPPVIRTTTRGCFESWSNWKHGKHGHFYVVDMSCEFVWIYCWSNS